jgi:hypothetical protein
MSNAALNWAWSVTGLNPVEKLVLVSLADQANPKTLQCNPGLECLRKRTCASLRGIRNAIGVLAGRGLIRRDLREGIGATYTLMTPAVSAAPTPAVSAPEPLREPRKKESEGNKPLGKEGSEVLPSDPEPLADPAAVKAAVGGYLGNMRGRIAAAPGRFPQRNLREQLDALDGPPRRPRPVEPIRSVEEQLAILRGAAPPAAMGAVG